MIDNSKFTVNLTDLRHLGLNRDHFKVKSLQNTIDYRIGDYLTSQQVQDLIDMGWTVNVEKYKAIDNL